LFFYFKCVSILDLIVSKTDSILFDDFANSSLHHNILSTAFISLSSESHFNILEGENSLKSDMFSHQFLKSIQVSVVKLLKANKTGSLPQCNSTIHQTTSLRVCNKYFFLSFKSSFLSSLKTLEFVDFKSSVIFCHIIGQISLLTKPHHVFFAKYFITILYTSNPESHSAQQESHIKSSLKVHHSQEISLILLYIAHKIGFSSFFKKSTLSVFE